MIRKNVKLGTIVTGNEALTGLAIGKAVYLDVSGDQFCSYMEITRMGTDKYELAGMWEVEPGICTTEEYKGCGTSFIMKVKYSKEIMKRVIDSGEFEHTETLPEVVTVDDLYEYILEEAHLYNDDRRNKISLETYTVVEIKD